MTGCADFREILGVALDMVDMYGGYLRVGVYEYV